MALKGHTALSELAKSEAFEKVAEPMDKDKVEEQVQAFKDDHEAKSKPVKWVNDKQIVADVTHTFKWVCEEVCLLTSCSCCILTKQPTLMLSVAAELLRQVGAGMGLSIL